MNKISMALITLGTCLAMEVTAQSRILPVLEATPDARSAAMGGTLLGHANQMHIYANPAALAFSDQRFVADASLEAQPKIDDGRLMQYNFAAGYRFANRSALMAGMRYLGGLTVPAVNAVGTTASVSPYDVTLDLGYAFSVTSQVAVYATATYAHAHAATSANALAFSLGAAFQQPFSVAKNMPSVLNLGVRLLDFGKSVKFNDTGVPQSLPTSLVAGGDWLVTVAPKHNLTYALSCRYFTPKDAHETLVGTGLEYTYNQLVSARVGYQFANKGSNALTVGAGGQLKGFKLNLAYHHAFAEYGVDALMVGVGYAF